MHIGCPPPLIIGMTDTIPASDFAPKMPAILQLPVGDSRRVKRRVARRRWVRQSALRAGSASSRRYTHCSLSHRPHPPSFHREHTLKKEELSKS
jgi:hypothetical protein